jgi:hypothetical protein
MNASAVFKFEDCGRPASRSYVQTVPTDLSSLQ